MTVCGPPTLIPRGMESLGCDVEYTLDRLAEADVVYALRMQHERMTDTFVPSLREYAARYQIDGRRLGARQVLMHPGPVNRGVELAAEVIDSPQAVIGEQVAAGVVVRMAVLYELLAGRGAPRPRPPRPCRPRSRHDPGRRDSSARRRPDPRRPRARPARGDRRAADVLVRDGVIAEIGASWRRRRAARSSTARAATCSRASSTRTCTCARPARSTRRTSTPAPAPPRPAATSPSSRCRTPTRWSTPRPCCARCARPRGARPACPSASWPRSRAACAGEALTEMAELRDAGALGFTDDGKPVHRAALLRKALQYQRLVRRRARPARGGPVALGRRRDARGRGLRRGSASPASRASRSRR